MGRACGLAAFAVVLCLVLLLAYSRFTLLLYLVGGVSLAVNAGLLVERLVNGSGASNSSDEG